MRVARTTLKARAAAAGNGKFIPDPAQQAANALRQAALTTIASAGCLECTKSIGSLSPYSIRDDGGRIECPLPHSPVVSEDQMEKGRKCGIPALHSDVYDYKISEVSEEDVVKACPFLGGE